jgi:hypothetical protein
MKKEIINNNISENEVYHRNMTFTCSICKSDSLPDNIFQNREIKSLLAKFKVKNSEVSNLITKCKCSKNTPRAHKLCLLLNIIYNFELKCPECNTDYNLSVKILNIPAKKICNIIKLLLVLLINIIIYGACALLILYPLVIDKEYQNGEEKKMFFISFCFFGALLFLINIYLTYITFVMFLFKNPNDSNDYIMEVKDINDQNKNKNSDKHYKLLYKFFRGFYGTQIRYLVSKKHRIIFISKGYGQFNKELQEIIIKNNIECEKEMEENNNGGEEILGLKNNRINSKSNKEKEKNNINNNVEKSNGNIDNSDSSEEDNKNKEDKNANYNKKINSNKNINSNLNNTSKKNNDILSGLKNEKNNIDIISEKSKSKISEKSSETLKQNKKKMVIEVINTDKPTKETTNLNSKEERKDQETGSNKTKKNSESNNTKKNRNKKNEIDSMSSRDIKANNKKFEESKESFISKKEEKDKKDGESSNKLNLIEGPNIFNDHIDLSVASPFHNNGK